ncbi:cytochrome c-type biogenesis protein [Magnetovibrio sp. PR-2]|uniref:cytochrome c-type biogenesis protein n=1 Tax=Magnetovibrio sp. PR-2 TaxID=3120356 RepID=UPI002FCDEEE7
MRTLLLALVVSFVLPFAAQAVEPDEILKDPALEARAREVGKQLRCVVCQNQAIDDSNAELARDMRILVRDRITAGDSNDEVMAYMVDRYGDFVLLDPPFKASTLVLWIGPGAIAVFGVFALVMIFRRRKSGGGEVVAGVQAEPLSDDERRRLDKLLKENDA